MKQARVYSAEIDGVFTQIKAYKKKNAVRRFQEIDPEIKEKQVHPTGFTNSLQVPIEDLNIKSER